jgi:glycosyltransferase involved in cell wall biosynthesis
MPFPSIPPPKVSVAMVTYNHEKFIAQAIESVLMQETTFPIELVIGEDCSTDNTRNIVKRCAALRPDVVWPIFHECNVGMHRNAEAVRKACRGQYIACLEGDDYWTSPHKLQKQVDFLDRHPDFSICGHRMMHVFPDRPECTPYPSPVQKESGTLEDILRWNYLPTCSVVYRAGLLEDLPAWLADLDHGDWPMWVLLAERGQIGFFNEVMADYRVHSGGVWMGASIEARIAGLEKTIKTIHNHLTTPRPAARRTALFTMHLFGARHFNSQAQYAKARARLLLALASDPVGFARAAEVRKLIMEQVHFYAVVKGREPVKRKYYRARIWAGAERRKMWKSAKALVGW